MRILSKSYVLVMVSLLANGCDSSTIKPTAKPKTVGEVAPVAERAPTQSIIEELGIGGAGGCGAVELPDDGGIHLVASRVYTWEPGTTLRVGFLDGKPEYRATVERLAKQWSKYANINFEFVSDVTPPPNDVDIRISFQRSGYWSLVGSQAAYRRKDVPTMNLNWGLFRQSESEMRRVVLHEFGHALGLWHEHQSPNLDVKWNKEVMYEYYNRHMGWTKGTVDSNIFAKLDPTRVDASGFDAKSIMAYSFPKEFTLNDVAIPSNTNLSVQDKRKIAELYPGRVKPDNPEQPVPTESTFNADKLASSLSYEFLMETGAQGKNHSYAMHVRGPAQAIRHVDHVLYQRQHKTFSEFARGTFYRSAGASTRFAFEWTGWGWTPIKARVVWSDGSVTEHIHRRAPVKRAKGLDWAALRTKIGTEYVQSAPNGKWRVYQANISPSDVLEHVAFVEYQRQHGTFAEFASKSFVRVDARAGGYPLRWRGYGWVPVAVRIHLKDGSVVEKLHRDAPADQ